MARRQPGRDQQIHFPPSIALEHLLVRRGAQLDGMTIALQDRLHHGGAGAVEGQIDMTKT
jgi:hypothetical protein